MEKQHGIRPRSWTLVLAATLLLGAAVLASAQSSWQLQEIGPGTKPALAVTADGQPYIIYMIERPDGWVKVASLENGSWRETTVANGYFYGPPDITVRSNGVPVGVYHDHQAQSFNPRLGDAVVAVLEAGKWSLSTVRTSGHDGWDARIAVDAQGLAHISSIDPLDFGGNGVEYFGQQADGSWMAETIGSGPQTYKYATSIALDADGTPHITYYDQRAQSLILASRGSDGWNLETVDDQGDTGLFSYLYIDPDGGMHISYLERTSSSSGNVRYAFRASPSDPWKIEQVGSLDSLFFGFTGARDITSLSMDSQGRPWLAYSDESVLRVAVRGEDGWQSQTVTEADGQPLGQIVSLKLDVNDKPHLAYSVITSKNPLNGVIWYATTN